MEITISNIQYAQCKYTHLELNRYLIYEYATVDVILVIEFQNTEHISWQTILQHFICPTIQKVVDSKYVLHNLFLFIIKFLIRPYQRQLQKACRHTVDDWWCISWRLDQGYEVFPLKHDNFLSFICVFCMIS